MVPISGYRGKILRINLTEKEVKTEPLDEENARKFVGGSGLGAYYYYKFMEQKVVEALSPENILIFFTGPLTGLPTACSGRFSICSRSPLTGIWGEANSGGKFGPELKFAGYDGIIVEGKSESPVYIYINDEKIEIRNAYDYWGMGVFESQEKILQSLGDNTFKIACIGPAGENLVKFASIMNDGARAAGRTGLGAVMGSKMLKAIVVKGSNKHFSLPEEFKEVSQEAQDTIMKDFSTELSHDLGTAGYVDLAVDMYGDLPIRNWSQGTYENAFNISGATMSETILVGRKACYRCPIACGREVEIPEGKYKLPITKGPEYETIGAFGTNLLIDDLEALAYANYMANSYGIDTISAGATIGVFLDLVSNNAIPKEDLLDKLDYSFGNPDTLIKLLRIISYREGIGNLLAEGSKKLAEHYDQPDVSPQIAGLEVPYHDPRAFSGMAVHYLTSPRGACHLNGDAYLVLQGLIFPELGIDDIPNRFENKGIAKQMANIQSYRQLYNAMTICQFYNPPAKLVAKLLGIAMREDIVLEELILLGERIFALKRLINLKLGWKTEWEKIPQIMLQKLEGPTEGNIPDYETQLKEWYTYRNYDRNTGEPKTDELKRLELLNF